MIETGTYIKLQVPVSWLSRRDSNPRVTESKSVALPLGDGSVYILLLLIIKKTSRQRISSAAVGDPSEIRTPDTLIKSQVLCQLS
jgi:hypothetical protein